MKILVIFTGGTIGSAETDGVIKLEEKTNFRLIEGYKKRTGDADTQFDTCSAYGFLSENLSADKINNILDTLADNIKEDYDGIILTHGTDTLQYTSAACAYAFAQEGKTIAIVASDYPLDDSRANGFENFAEAVRIIKEGRRGVFVCYKNADNIAADTHLATRIVQYSECSDKLLSISGASPANIRSMPDGRYSDEREILVIDCIPNIRYAGSLDGIKAIIIRPYHSATINSEDKELLDICTRAREREVPVFLVNSREGKDYESKKVFDALGITLLPKCTFAAIYMKCWLAASMGVDMADFVNNEIYGEFC